MSNLALVQQTGSSLAKGIMPPGMVITSIQDAITIGKILAQSRFFKDADTESKAVAKILRGWELGIPPVASLENIYVIDGKTTLSVHLIAAKIKASGRFRQRIIAHTAVICQIQFLEKFEGAWEELGISEFNMDDAKTANLLGKKNWVQYPKAMLYARALAQGARWFCSEVFMGEIYVPEELGLETDGDGNVIDLPSIFRSNSEQISDLLDDLEITDPTERKQVALQHLAGRKAADLSTDELEAVLLAMRQALTLVTSDAIPVSAQVVSPTSIPTPVGEDIPVVEDVSDDDNFSSVATSTAETEDVAPEQRRAFVSDLLDQLGIHDAAQRQKAVREHLGRRKLEALDMAQFQAVVNGIRREAF